MNIRKCKFCGQEFVPRSNRQIYCDREHYRQCPSCGELYIERYSENLKRPPRLCCSTCRITHREPEYVEHETIWKSENIVLVDSQKKRNKYDNLNISKYYRSIGIDCVHVFPEDDIDKLIQQCSCSKTLDASELNVYKLSRDYTAEFLKENDTVSFYESTSVALGLVKNNEIYQVMTFASSRYTQNYEYEIIRCCTKLGCKIENGLDILSSQASIILGIHSCIAYQDMSKTFSLQPYQSINMKLSHINPPRLRKSSVYDCGTAVFVF